MPEGKDEIVICGLDSSLIASEEAMKVHDIQLEARKVVYAGKLNRRKRVDRIINALSAIQDEMAFSLSIIGDGDQGEVLENLAKDNGSGRQVMFMGLLPLEVVSAAMFDSDVFIMVYGQRK